MSGPCSSNPSAPYADGLGFDNMKLIDQLKFKFTGRSVPVLKVSEVDNTTGLVRILQDVGPCRLDPNRIVNPWDNTGWEINKEAEPVIRMSDKGTKEVCYVVSSRGQSCNLYTQPWKGPALENVIGRTACLDTIAEILGLTPSMRDKFIFLTVGLLLGWLIVGPLMNTILS